MTSKRAHAWLWMKAPMPMVTVFKTLNVSNLCRRSRRGYTFNMLMCYCIGRAAMQTEEMFLMPVGEKLIEYERDKLAIGIVVELEDGTVANCDLPFSMDIEEFDRVYRARVAQVRESGRDVTVGEDYAVIGASAVLAGEIDGVVNMYTGIYKNPFFAWARYHQSFFKTTLKLSMQFHHTQMDGGHAVRMLERLQKEIDALHLPKRKE